MKFIKSLVAAATVAIASCTVQPVYAQEHSAIKLELCSAVADLAGGHMEYIYHGGSFKESLHEIENSKALEGSSKLKSYVLAGVVKFNRDKKKSLIASRRDVYNLCLQDYN